VILRHALPVEAVPFVYACSDPWPVEEACHDRHIDSSNSFNSGARGLVRFAVFFSDVSADL